MDSVAQEAFDIVSKQLINYIKTVIFYEGNVDNVRQVIQYCVKPESIGHSRVFTILFKDVNDFVQNLTQKRIPLECLTTERYNKDDYFKNDKELRTKIESLKNPDVMIILRINDVQCNSLDGVDKIFLTTTDLTL